MDIHRITLKITPEKNIRILRLSVRDPSVGAFPEASGESAFSLLAEGLLRESAAVSVLSTARGLSNLVSAALSSRVRLLLCSSKTGRCLCAGTVLSTGCLSRIHAGSAAGSSRTDRTLSRHLYIRISIFIPECPVESAVCRSFIPGGTLRCAF